MPMKLECCAFLFSCIYFYYYKNAILGEKKHVKTEIMLSLYLIEHTNVQTDKRSCLDVMIG